MAAAATVAAVLVLPTAGPAVAGQRIHDDPTSDVVQWHSHTDTGTVDPADRLTDITSLTTEYADRRVTMRVKLRRVPVSDFWTAWDIRTADRLLQVQLRELDGGLFLHVLDWTGSFRRLGSCPGASYAIRPAKDAMRVTVPRRCFGGGPWVRTGMQMTRDYNEATQTYPADDARLDGEITHHQISQLGRRISYN